MSAQPILCFKIYGMDCAEEVAALKREVGPLLGGADRLTFDILGGRMLVTPGTPPVAAEAVVQAVTRTGLRAELIRDDEVVRDRGSLWQRQGRTLLTALSGLLTLAGLTAHVWAAGGVGNALRSGAGALSVPPAGQLLYGFAALAGSWYVLPKAWRSLTRLRPDMNLLMTVAVLGAVALGEWLEAATVAFLFALSLVLESWSVARARRAVAGLMDLSPPTARLLSADGREQLVPPTEVPVGARFAVRPGERIALDGTVARGTSAVNQSPITGESAPVAKAPGDQVFAGTVNGDGVLEVACTKAAGDTTLAHIIRMVGEAQARRAPSEQWVERFARVYTPTVMALAIALLFGPPLLFHGAWADWLYRSLVLLVIACPCALVISTPVSIVAAVAAAARAGVLIKGGLYVEVPASLSAIAFDKTGTLTLGRPAVVGVVAMNGHTEAEVLERAAALEAQSSHPLAEAVVAFSRERGLPIRPAEDAQAVPGKGMTGMISGQRFWLGSHRFLEERGQETEAVHRELEELARGGRTVVVVGNDRHVCGFLSLADALRPETREALKALHALGVRHIVMVTGDNAGTARAIAAEAGIDEVHAEVLPEEKVRLVEELVARYGRVGMVGDGVNDAPALGRATLGIAMGVIGSDAAIETADVALMADDLSKLPWLVRHSRRTLAVIRQNIGFSLAVKGLFVVLTLAGHASLWAAIAADTGASLVVIANGLRLLRGADSRRMQHSSSSWEHAPSPSVSTFGAPRA